MSRYYRFSEDAMLSYDHDISSVRIAAQFAEQAFRYFERGEIGNAIACIANAKTFSDKVYVDGADNVRRRSTTEAA